jgi:hypothetical protein
MEHGSQREKEDGDVFGRVGYVVGVAKVDGS